MNKGIIMEINKNYAIVLNQQGVMEKIQSKENMKMGQKIFYFEDDIVKSTIKLHSHSSFMKIFGSIAALFLIVFTFFFNTATNNKVYAVVSLDINPSIQIEADSNQKIIRVDGINADGKSIDFSDVKGENIDDGIEKIKEKLVEKNYLDNNKEVLVAFAFVQNDGNSNYEEEVKDAIQSTFKSEKITYVKADKDDVEQAKTEGISLGRYEVAINADEETKSKIDKAPVKDITSIIKDKQNVIQWQAQDEESKMDNNSAQNDNSAVSNSDNNDNNKSLEQSSNSKSKNDKSTNDKNIQEKPKTTESSDNGNSGTVTTPDQDKNNNSANNADNGVLEVKPEPQVPNKQPEKSNNSDTDNTITIAPNNGVIENNTTSSKIDDQNKSEDQNKSTVQQDTTAKDTSKTNK